VVWSRATLFIRYATHHKKVTLSRTFTQDYSVTVVVTLRDFNSTVVITHRALWYISEYGIGRPVVHPTHKRIPDIVPTAAIVIESSVWCVLLMVIRNGRQGLENKAIILLSSKLVITSTSNCNHVRLSLLSIEKSGRQQRR
jgi:hypothetical protein